MQILGDGHAKHQNEECMTSSFKGNMKTSEDPKTSVTVSDATCDTVKREAKNKKTKTETA